MADTPTPPSDPADRDAELTDPDLFGVRPSDPPDATFVVLELDVDWDGHGTRPPSAPIGPFVSRAAAAVHARLWVDRYGGGSFSVGPLTPVTYPPPKTAAELLDDLTVAVARIAAAGGQTETPAVAAAVVRRDRARAELEARLNPAAAAAAEVAELRRKRDAGAVAGMRRPPRGKWAHDNAAGIRFWVGPAGSVYFDDTADPIVNPDGTGNYPYVQRLDADRLLDEFAGLAHQLRAPVPSHVIEHGPDAVAHYNTGLASALAVLRDELVHRMATDMVGSDYQLAMRRQPRDAGDGYDLYSVVVDDEAIQWVLPEKLTGSADTLIVRLHPVTGP